MRRIARWLAIAVGLVGLSLAAGVVVPKPLWNEERELAMEAPREVLLLSNPIHTDIALRIDEALVERFGFLELSGLPLRHPGGRFLVVGWGGRAFYLETPRWADLKAGPVARALTLDRSVMHVLLTGEIDAGDPAVKRLWIDEDRYDSLVSAIVASFAPGGNGRPQLITGRSYGEFDRFYEAHGWFKAFVGCNTWTAEMLRVAGLKTGIWTPLPKPLVWSLALHNDERRVQSGLQP